MRRSSSIGVVERTNGQGARATGERNNGCQWHPLNEAADIRMGFWFTLKFETERFGMAFRLPFTSPLPVRNLSIIAHTSDCIGLNQS